jgi:hypothetical protein
MGDIPTVKVQHNMGGQKGYQVINESDYDPKVHKLYKGDGEGADATTEDAGRNASGTFSEPTPTDIRYPDKDTTEFENNHGAFVDKSAAELREEKGLPDAPGGLEPDPEFDPSEPGAVTKAAEPENAPKGKK